MSIQLRLTVTDNFMWILDANHLATCCDTYEWEIIRTWDPQITDTKEAWIVHPTETNGCRDNCESILEANWPGDASATKSIKVQFNGFIRELQSYQLQHEWDLISYLPIESIDDYRDDSSAHRDALKSRPTSAISYKLSSRHRPQLHTQVHLQLYSSQPCEVHLRRIRAELRDTHYSHLAMPLMAVPIVITSYKTEWNYLHYGWCQKFTAVATEVLQGYIQSVAMQ